MFKKGNWIHICLSLAWLFCLPGHHIRAQEPVHTQLQEQVQTQVQKGVYTLVDFVYLDLGIQGLPDTLCSVEFLEEWIIFPSGHSLEKQVLDQDSSCMSLLLSLPIRKGIISIRNINYEFNLLDPHLLASENVARPEADSMDAPTRRLQIDLINLIRELRDPGERYQLEDQLLSVRFYEDWSMDQSSRKISKKVRGISPVIWQRRKTADGHPVNDGDTGLPVYYKIELERIELRNP